MCRAAEPEKSSYRRWSNGFVLEELHSDRGCELGPSEGEVFPTLLELGTGRDGGISGRTAHRRRLASGTNQPNSNRDMRVLQSSRGLDLLCRLYSACGRICYPKGVPSQACVLLGPCTNHTTLLQRLLPRKHVRAIGEHSLHRHNGKVATHTSSCITLGSMNTGGTVTLCDIAALI